MDAAEADEPRYWAARVTVPLLEDQEQVGVAQRLIVVEADGPEDARRESAFVEAEFVLADEATLEEWDMLTSTPLNQEEIGRLMVLVRRELVSVANKEAKAEGFGKSRDDRFRLLDRVKAATLVRLQGKLDTMLHD